MKFLQTHKNGVKLENPKILELEKDFDLIWNRGDNTNFVCGNFADYTEESPLKYICEISDCYQSRPLIEIDVSQKVSN